MTTAPPLTYFGGKTRMAERIVSVLPRHRHYVEPFAGSLAVLLAKPLSKHETVSDIDGKLMLFWRVLRDRPADLARVCALTPHSRAEHLEAYALSDDMDELEQARLVWIQLTQGRAGLRSKTGWRYYVDPGGTNLGMPGYLEAYVSRMAAAAERLHNVSLESRPALELITSFGASSDVCIYADPPYVSGTRSSGSYLHEMGSENDHMALASALHECEAAVVLSGYPSPLYDSLYAEWERIEFATMTGQGGSNQARTEVLWSNRPLAGQHLFSSVTA